MLSQLLHIINQPFIIIPFSAPPPPPRSWWLPQVGWVNIPVQTPRKAPQAYFIKLRLVPIFHGKGWFVYGPSLLSLCADPSTALASLPPEVEMFMGNSSAWDLVEPGGF